MRSILREFSRWQKLGWALATLVIAVSLKVTTADPRVPQTTARVIAIGIPGAGAISAIGTFHPGGPIHDKPAFRAFTEPGSILDPERILVTSTSNFGAPLARPDLPAGSVISIDPRNGVPLVIPADFAVDGGQTKALSGRLALLTSNSPAFLNSIYNPDALTANLPALGNPTGISLNNAFGRIWITSMPSGPNGAGFHAIVDPDGRPLNGAPNKAAGGVFTGTLTNRAPEQLIKGCMATGALSTALLGKSPDASGRAVFAGLHADGSVVQLHTEAGVDGLAPAGTVTPLRSGDPAVRMGMLLNWVPDPILYVADPTRNSIVAISLRSEEKAFHVQSIRRLTNPALNMPADMAPTTAEIANPVFSSNTTLAGGADFYVVNRGTGEILRLKQSGQLVGSRGVTMPGVGPLGAARLNGIAISPDATRIWLTVSGNLPGYPDGGAIIEVPAFGGSSD